MVTLVTLPESSLKTKRDHERHNAFVEISRLFAKERSPELYRLVAHSSFHDRWLQCDNRIFSLGGSIKDINKGAFTVSHLSGSAENSMEIERSIQDGVELFGPNCTTHP